MTPRRRRSSAPQPPPDLARTATPSRPTTTILYVCAPQPPTTPSLVSSSAPIRNKTRPMTPSRSQSSAPLPPLGAAAAESPLIVAAALYSGRGAARVAPLPAPPPSPAWTLPLGADRAPALFRSQSLPRYKSIASSVCRAHRQHRRRRRPGRGVASTLPLGTARAPALGAASARPPRST